MPSQASQDGRDRPPHTPENPLRQTILAVAQGEWGNHGIADDTWAGKSSVRPLDIQAPTWSWALNQ